MDLSSQKRIASQIMKCGISRVKIKPDKEVEEALTREDIRNLIRRGLIWKVQKKGTAKFNVKRTVRQKKKGRMRGHGSRKGTAGARKPRKRIWMETVRPQRRVLRELRESEMIDKRTYGKIYLMIKGGAFRNKQHLMYYMKDHELLKKPKDAVAKKKPGKSAKKPVKPAGKTGAVRKRVVK
jgi:large subunit ribosomal protein L19e